MGRNTIHIVFIFSTILMLLAIVISFCMFSNNKEAFTNSYDIKTKTLNWCDKMKNVGLLTPDQFNQCVSTFKETTNNIGINTTQNQFKVPQTGMSRNYSIYNNSGNKNSINNDTDDNTNTIMLTNNIGLTLACKPDNSIYLVSNINDHNINQKELYFTLIPQTDNIFAILSPYGKYLISNTDYSATFTGTSIGPLASWSITKINTISNVEKTTSTIMIGSIQFNDFYILCDNTTHGLKLVYGKNDNMKWIINHKSKNNMNNNNNIGAEYHISKENIIQRLQNEYVKKICLKASIISFKSLYSIISNNFNNIANYLNDKLFNEQKLYKLHTLDYQTRLKSINQNSMIDDEAKQNLISNIPLPSGLNISDNDIIIVVNKITTAKSNFLTKLQNDIINQLEQELNTLEKNNINNEYNTYIQSLQTELTQLDNKINQNNNIINRQTETFTKLNQTYANTISKQQHIENINNIANINMHQLNNYYNQNYYLNKLYPIGIIILISILIYISYLTFIKFHKNML